MQMVFALEHPQFLSLIRFHTNFSFESSHVYRYLPRTRHYFGRRHHTRLPEKRVVVTGSPEVWLPLKIERQPLFCVLRNALGVATLKTSKYSLVMLDLQRQRSSVENQGSLMFTQILITGHLVVGFLGVAMLIFQGYLAAGGVAAGWFVVSLALVAGMGKQINFCRIGLSAWFLVGLGLSAYYLVWGLEPLPLRVRDDEVGPSIARKLLPIWLSSLAMAYAGMALILLVSRRVKRATGRGFSLWDAPREK
jgi:hypothetical protein